VSERWMPILAAVVGVLGGMGGAFIGGYVANEGQEQRFDREQDVRREDLRRTTYADFLLAAAAVNQGPGSDEQIARADSAEATVQLFADRAISEAASALTDALHETGACIERAPQFEPGTDEHQQRVQECYHQAQARFVQAGKAQLEAGK
jgi:hypothetical protein